MIIHVENPGFGAFDGNRRIRQPAGRDKQLRRRQVPDKKGPNFY